MSWNQNISVLNIIQSLRIFNHRVQQRFLNYRIQLIFLGKQINFLYISPQRIRSQTTTPLFANQPGSNFFLRILLFLPNHLAQLITFRFGLKQFFKIRISFVFRHNLAYRFQFFLNSFFFRRIFPIPICQKSDWAIWQPCSPNVFTKS